MTAIVIYRMSIKKIKLLSHIIAVLIIACVCVVLPDATDLFYVSLGTICQVKEFKMM